MLFNKNQTDQSHGERVILDDHVQSGRMSRYIQLADPSIRRSVAPTRLLDPALWRRGSREKSVQRGGTSEVCYGGLEPWSELNLLKVPV